MIRTVNIKQDRPTADAAVRRVNMILNLAKSQGDKAIKIVHGYGSTGQGGVIRTHVRRYLQEQKNRGRVRLILPGEEFSIFNPVALQAFACCPELRRDADLERCNPGITVVVL
ncbi:MAG: Smr/MutS family protein [Oscillospiraceae bacterium]|nr:Smr/MutS family protein [Oscillospiraceae bacterium]